VLIVHGILAGIAVAGLALHRRRGVSVGLAGGAALIDLMLGADIRPMVSVVAPLAIFLAAALALAMLIEDSGLSARLADLLAGAARGRTAVLYALVCLVSAVLTLAASLDAAVVVMVPLLACLKRHTDSGFAALFLGAVAVANGASMMVPQGNPTNLVVMGSLGLSSASFTEHMLLPGLAAATICALGVAARFRPQLGQRYLPPKTTRGLRATGDERYALAALITAAVAGWAGLLAGLAPWWPFAGAVALFVAGRRRPLRLGLPWWVAVQVSGLVVTLKALALHLPESHSTGLGVLLVVAAVVGLAAAAANNLPISATAAGLLSHGPTAYAASVGLAVGALATPQGSVATLLARDLAGPIAPPFPSRDFALISALAVTVATALVGAT